MSRQRERQQFIVSFIGQYAPQSARGLDDARLLLKYATTLQRLAEAQCNGDYPYEHGSDGGPYVTCRECEGRWYASAVNKAGVCVDCRTAKRVHQVAAQYGLLAYTQGDPRGYVVKLFPAGTTVDQMHASSGGLGVPS
jgi:hypothetical protein